MTQQKDLQIFRINANKSTGKKYEYQLFKNGQWVKTHATNNEVNFASVHVDPTDGSTRIDHLCSKVSDFDKREFEDSEIFIVPVTIK